MAKLTNERWEIFAQGRAIGLSNQEAAIKAGCTGKAMAVIACKLNKNPVIQARIDEIQNDGSLIVANMRLAVVNRVNYTRDQALQECDVAMQIAISKKNVAGIIQATTLKSRLMGLLVDRQEIKITNIAEMDDEQLDTLIRDYEAGLKSGTGEEGSEGVPTTTH